ncbi:hypothetical protein GCM10010198_61580 [Nocardia seriolae]|nr:hypothetical protein NS2_43620 [Nocardia seriolae NBRC 15557]
MVRRVGSLPESLNASRIENIGTASATSGQSQQARDILDERFSAQAGDSARVVFESGQATPPKLSSNAGPSPPAVAITAMTPRIHAIRTARRWS